VKRLVNRLSIALVMASSLGALAAVAIGMLVGFWALTNAERATLSAASIVVRDAVAGAGRPALDRELRALSPSLRSWGLTAAAFGPAGRLIAGDERLAPDGQWSSGRPAAPASRQLAVVETRAGYVILATDPAQAALIRRTATLAALLMIVLVPLVTLAAGRPLIALRLEASDAGRSAEETRLRAFLADAGHELRTPLAIASGYLGILRRGAIHDPVLAERIVGDVERENERLQRLVERILHLARLDATNRDATAASDVDRTIDEAIALVRPLDLDDRIARSGASGAWAAVEPDELRDALRNLLENAIRYAPGAAVTVDAKSAGAGVTIAVRDDGPGMDAFTAGHAFDRFFRGANRGEVAGSGLGLSIVRGVAERVGGSAALRTAPGSGTTVTLRLPARRRAP
jgi:signal transduction histidine kinase